MIATQSKGRKKQGGEMLFRAFGLAAFVVAFTLLTPVPLHADTFYSGAAVNSDGSVYSWGVTSACSMSSHTTHMTSTLTSPKGRQASGNASDGCETEVNLYLAFESTDTGMYTVVSYSWAYCPVLDEWFWIAVESEGSANNAYPINFTQSGSSSLSDGRLQFTYTWQSSSKNIMDLQDCVVYEAVTYQGPPGVYKWPSPPWNTSVTNPSVGPTPKIPGSNGTGGDTQYTGTFVTPYGTNHFDATQVYEYSCPVLSGDLATGITIHREVDQNGSYYTYKITKSGASASCTLGVNCYNK